MFQIQYMRLIVSKMRFIYEQIRKANGERK